MNNKVKMVMLVVAAIVWDLIGVYLIYMAYQATLALTGNVGVAIVAGMLVVEIFFVLEAIIMFRWMSQLMPMLRRSPATMFTPIYNIIVKANGESYSDEEDNDYTDAYDNDYNSDDEDDDGEFEADDECRVCEYYHDCFPEHEQPVEPLVEKL